jgi:1,6-anhydro-N-acetylmuramate kinase
LKLKIREFIFMAKKVRRSRPGKAAAEPLVNPFLARHGSYQEATIVDLGNELGGGRQKTYRVVRNLHTSVVDRWLAEGGPGFDEPQRRAIDHCRALWHRIGGSGTLVANLNWIGGGHSGRERGLEQAEALAQLTQYESRIPRLYWSVFENVVRNDMAAGAAGSPMARNSAQAQAHAKNCVGFVASLIALWRGF